MKTAVIPFIILGLLACHTSKELMYELPAAMAEPTRVAYAKLCEKGKILYDLNCARCHTTKKQGKEFIPDFTADQLEVYQVRLGNIKHEVNVSEEKVSAEELALITTFLTYKKKNAVTSGIGITNSKH